MEIGPGSWLKNYLAEKHPDQPIKVALTDEPYDVGEALECSGPEFDFD